MTETRNLFSRWGLILVAIWFILWGVATVFSIAVPPILLGILAIAAGIGVFVSR